ncbi:tetratricopeptide repeat-containing sensor histidine kinase [Chryseolinea lacunae]|uniref:histidine kinase n=1 Tax=Chryseolinea lacunae TaxID=2801331 RepID=A0ABS1KKF0_9BACT|nr:tetratricopeptide repeat protein [Chryseolinea lacunae]MBL0739935.1 tetratricopeptide repeat protein [Chryseolinea lacunae]
MRGVVLVAFALFLFAPAKSQHGQRLVDSLETKLKATHNDTLKAKLYSRLSDLYIDIDQDQALHYADSVMQLSTKMKWQRGIADAKLAFGNVYNFNGSPEKAVGYLKDAIATYQSIAYKRGEGMSLYALGQSYERTSDFPQAIQYYFQALQIQETLPDNHWEVAICLSAISVIYYLQRDYEKSLDYSFKALAKKELAKNKTSIANELYNIGDTYSHMGDSANAATYNLKALALFDQLGNKMGQANVCSSLGKLFRKNYRLSLEYLDRARKIYLTVSSHSPYVAITEGQLGQVFVDMVKSGDTLSLAFRNKHQIPTSNQALLNVGETYIQHALEACREIGDKDTEYIFYGDLAELQALKGDHKNAFLNFKLYHHLRDSLYSQENKNKIAAVEGQREVALRDKEIELNKQTLATQRQQQITLLAGLAFLAVTGLLLYRQNRMRKVANEKLQTTNHALDEANKTKAKFFAILSHDLRGPIARLISFLHLQKEAPDMLTPQQVQLHRQKIVDAAETLLDNMEDMLLWSKSQMDQFHPAPKHIAIDQLFQQTKEAVGAPDHIALLLTNPENLEVYADENFVRAILYNITNNAVTALHATTHAKVEWKAWQTENNLVLSIADNGPGMSAEALANMFKNETVTSTKHGFGSHIVKDLAHAIQCDIETESETGKGTTVYLKFAQSEGSDHSR